MRKPVKSKEEAESLELLIFWWCLALAAAICISGCGDFFASKPTEIEARAILKELSQVRESPHINNPLPAIYRAPATRVKVKDGVKLFYFTRHHTVDKLTGLVKEQLGKKISQSGPTNQLIIHCTDHTDADKVLEFLDMTDVPPIQVNIDCLILERFGDETMDRETSIMIENFLGQEITLGANRGTFDSGGVLTALSPAFPGASLRESLRSTFGLDFGYWIDKGVPGHQVRAVVDLLISRGYLKILLNPTLETINGKQATVSIRDYAPIEKIVAKEGFDEPFSMTDYKWVEDTLTVTPSVFADSSIGLKTSIKIGSKSKPEGVVQTSIITERSINVDENRISPGESLIIGGMRKSEKRSVVRGVPFLKDIPILGLLFSSKDFEEKATEIIFILTPSISSGSVEHAKIVEDIRKKHSSGTYETGLAGIFTDPFGTGVYTAIIERKAVEAETERIRAEIEAAQMSEEVAKIKGELSKTRQQLDVEKVRFEKAHAEREKAITEAATAAAEAQKARQIADTAKAEADAAKVAADKAEKRALAEKQKAQKAAAQAAKIKAQAQKTKAEPQPAKTEPQDIEPQAEKMPASQSPLQSKSTPDRSNQS